jgi:hypothetical protein
MEYNVIEQQMSYANGSGLEIIRGTIPLFSWGILSKTTIYLNPIVVVT